MATERSTTFCHNCNTQRMFIRDGPNHILHLIITILTGGLWLVGWLISVLPSRSNPYRCTRCGMTSTKNLVIGRDMR